MKGCLKFIVYSIIGIIIMFVAIAIIFPAMLPDTKESESETEMVEEEYVEPNESEYNYEQDNNEIENNNIENYRKVANIWVGDWYGKDNCSMGRNANEWSNKYKIHFRMVNNVAFIKGIYFQANEEIRAEVTENEILIKKQNIGSGNFIIQGSGSIEEDKLKLQYQVEVLVDTVGNYETNYCLAEFKKKIDGVVEYEIKKRTGAVITLPEKGQWCLWEIEGDERIWIEGYVPNHGYAKYNVESKELPMYLGYQKEFKIETSYNDVNVIFKQCEKQ